MRPSACWAAEGPRAAWGLRFSRDGTMLVPPGGAALAATLIALAAALIAGPLDAATARPEAPGARSVAHEADVPIAAGTRLAALRDRYQARVAELPARDAEDPVPLPPWFRVYLRDSFKSLPRSGPYQYPHSAPDMLEWMVSHPDFTQFPPGGVTRSMQRLVHTGMNFNLTANASEANNEPAVARNPASPQFLIAASNTRRPWDSWQQRQFYSGDSGGSWQTSMLPLYPSPEDPNADAQQVRNFHGDPSLAYSSDGKTAWATTLGFNTSDNGATVWLQLYKSLDQGAIWEHVAEVSKTGGEATTPGANDRPMLAIGASPAGSDRLYVAWNVLGGDRTWLIERPSFGILFARSDDGVNWTTQRLTTPESSSEATGASVATGPAGEVYVAWAAAKAIWIRRSTDGGANFDPPIRVAGTQGQYRVRIRASEIRAPMIYPVVSVDRSSTVTPAPVYVAWTDCDRSPCPKPGSPGYGSTKVYVSKSSWTNGVMQWSSQVNPRAAPTQTPRDQFNPWMDVDPSSGRVHLAFYDTREDSTGNTTNLYYESSPDGGTWDTEMRVTTAPSDETDSKAAVDQYGDYNGLVARGGVPVLAWTDRRDKSSHEQIYLATVVPVWVTLCLSRQTCHSPISMVPGGITLHCDLRPCLIVDPLPHNCLVKFDCPVCRPGRPCRQRWRIALDGLKGHWTVGLRGPAGEEVRHRVVQAGKGVALEFTPDPGVQRDALENYALTFTLNERGQLGKSYKIGTSLDVAPIER